MAEEEKPSIAEELEQPTEEEAELKCPPSLTPKPRKTDIALYCERSLTNFPLGSSSIRGWVYICDYKCPKEYVVESPHEKTVYCASAEDFYNDIAVLLLRGEPISFGRDYFILRLRKGKEKSVRKCIIEGVDCETDYWILSVRPTGRAIMLFSTDQKQVEEFFGIQIKSPFMRIRGADAIAHAIIESVKDMESLTRDVMSTLDLMSRKPGAVSKGIKTYVAISEAIAQIVMGCMAFGSDFVRRNMRFMTCGNFVPMPYLINIVRYMKKCEEARDWDCMAAWIIELDNLIDAYRRPGPPYELPRGEKYIFETFGPSP